MSWDKRDVWIRKHKTFSVEIVHWRTDYNTVEEGESPNNNMWNVYAEIYEGHPRYDLFVGSEMFQAAAEALPLHGGLTYLTKQYDGYYSLYKVGSDYAHYRDDRFTRFSTAKEAYEVFADAAELFIFLLNDVKEIPNDPPTVS